MPIEAVDQFLRGREAFLKARSDQQAQAEGILFALVGPTVQQISASFAAQPDAGVRLQILASYSRGIEMQYIPIPIPEGNMQLLVEISDDNRWLECPRFSERIALKGLSQQSLVDWMLGLLRRLDPAFKCSE